MRTVTYYAGHQTEHSGHVHVRGNSNDIEDGVYLHRDDVCDMIRQMGPNRANEGAKELPTIATAVPAWIAERLRLVQ